MNSSTSAIIEVTYIPLSSFYLTIDYNIYYYYFEIKLNTYINGIK